MTTNDGNIKKVLLAALDFFRAQVENDACSLDEMRSMLEVIVRDIRVMASADELSDFFGQSASNVRNVLSRRIIPARSRERVMRYDMRHVLRIIPERWMQHRKHS